MRIIRISKTMIFIIRSSNIKDYPVFFLPSEVSQILQHTNASDNKATRGKMDYLQHTSLA